MLVKNHEGALFPKLIYRMLLDGLAAVRFIALREWKHLASVFNAHMALYKRLPILLKQRKEIHQNKGKTNTSGLYQGSIIWARYFKGVTKFKALNQRLFDSK